MWKFLARISLLIPLVVSASDLKSSLETIAKKYTLPGLAAAAYQDGRLLDSAAVGVRKVGNSALLTDQDKFHLGSCTKAMTATLIATFIEEGKLSWTSNLFGLFPEIDVHPKLKNITIEMLLTHASGLAANPSYDFKTYLKNLDLSVARKILAETYSQMEPTGPAATFLYSNIGYMILGHVMEKISGRSWEMLINERIFSALNMVSCHFGPTSEPGNAQVEQPWAHYTSEQGQITPVHSDNPLFYGPAGAVHCTLEDWAKFLNVHVQGYNGESHFLRADSFEKLQKTALKNYTYGAWLRLERNWAGGPVLTHNGSNELNFAVVWLALKKKAILISTSNIGGDNAYQGTDEAIAALINQIK